MLRTDYQVLVHISYTGADHICFALIPSYFTGQSLKSMVGLPLMEGRIYDYTHHISIIECLK